MYAGKPGRQVRWTDRTGVISSLGAVTDPHVSQAVLSWKPITPIWREVARSRRKQEQTDKLKQSELLTPLRNKNLAAQQRLQIDARVMRITSRNPRIWSYQFGCIAFALLAEGIGVALAFAVWCLLLELNSMRILAVAANSILVPIVAVATATIVWNMTAFTRFFERVA